MSKRRRFTSKLIGVGHIFPELHYGIFARNWWEPVSVDLENIKISAIPYRLYMCVKCNLNSKDFIITVVKNNKNQQKPGFRCTCENVSSEIEPYPSTAINSCYKKVFNTKTEYSGIAIMGFEDKSIIQQLIYKVEFFPIFLWIERFLVVISGLGYSSKNGYYGAGMGFISSFITRFRSAQHLFLLKIENNQCLLEIYQDTKIIQKFVGFTPDDVWKKVGILKNFSGSYIFGITHESTQQLLNSENNNAVTCLPDEWNDIEKLTKVFDRHIKSRKIPNTMINWTSLFNNWYKQYSTVILFPSVLFKIYPEDYKFQDKELRAWRAMFKACGCSDVTPFLYKKSQIEFWSRAYNNNADKQMLNNLCEANLLSIKNKCELISLSTSLITNQNSSFWESFRKAMDFNKRGYSGKIRILSIIALKFRYMDLQRELGVSKNIIYNKIKYKINK